VEPLTRSIAWCWQLRYNKKAGFNPALLTHVLHLRTQSIYQTVVSVHVTSYGDRNGTLLELGHVGLRAPRSFPKVKVLICNPGGKVPFFDLSREQQVVWQNLSGMTIPLGHGIQRLDVEGEPWK
jgi:hypothetical protein